MGHDLTMFLGTVVSFAVLLLGYLLPAIVAARRGHPNANAIAVLNLLLGWTFVGWAVALVWALTAAGRDERK